MQSLQRLQESFCKRLVIHLPPLSRIDWTITLWFCSTRGDQVLHRRTYAHFFPHELQQLRDIRSEYPVPATRKTKRTKIFCLRLVSWEQRINKKIINIVELCPTVNSRLERTSEGNPGVKYVDQVQNPTKNPFTYLMSTIAFFKLQMISFLFICFNSFKFTHFPLLPLSSLPNCHLPDFSTLAGEQL